MGCKINCSGGCPECAPDEHTQVCVESYPITHKCICEFYYPVEKGE